MKTLKIVGNILYWILFVLTILILLVVIIQRFSNNSLSLAGFRIFNVVTESMVPKYNVGDVLLSKSMDTDQIKVGDDVTYMGVDGDFKDKIVTHELVAIEDVNGQKIFHTKGIANDTEDPPISGSQIFGVVVCKVPVLSQISKILSNVYAFYFVVFIPLVILIFIEIRKMVIGFKKNDE
ncbi:MAG: signal peptidase I [Oscillospiraceae bacterium]|nr:signal peptidase I [Oscillospiraceae bacterium]